MAKVGLTPQERAGRLMANLSRKHKWRGNILQLMAERYQLYATNEEEILQIDMTEPFLRELRREVSNKEIVKMVVNAKPRLGKSTIAILLGKYIHDLLREYYPSYTEGKEFGVWNIARDEDEYMVRMRKHDLMYDVIVIDERNAMDDTGENATLEKAQKEMFSDIQAGRYVMNIYITPEKQVDDNNDIRLVVRNREKGFTHCRLYYRLNRGQYSMWVLLGYVNLDVSDLIKNWMKVEKRFMRHIKGDYESSEEKEKDRKYIEYWRKKDFYVDYMFRKYEKMEIMNKEKILRSRDLNYAEIYLNVVEDLKELVDVMSVTSLKRTCDNYIEDEMDKQDRSYSMLGRDRASERVMGLLGSYIGLSNLQKDLAKLKKMKESNKLTIEEYEERMKKIKKAGDRLAKSIDKQEGRWFRYAKLKAKYEGVL